MYMGYLEPGDACTQKGCGGRMHFPKVRNCSCHINPPCSACTDNELTCKECGWVPDEPESKMIPVAPVTLDGPNLYMREYKPRPLDNTKIDYRIKMHTHFSQICEGVYPEGTTQEQVLDRVKGTFGGRFESFGGGKFKYIAYTD